MAKDYLPQPKISRRVRPFNALSFIMDMEAGVDLSADDVIYGYQQLINSGVIYQLQGSWQRAAQAMVKSGHCTIPTTNRRSA